MRLSRTRDHSRHFQWLRLNDGTSKLARPVLLSYEVRLLEGIEWVRAMRATWSQLNTSSGSGVDSYLAKQTPEASYDAPVPLERTDAPCPTVRSHDGESSPSKQQAESMDSDGSGGLKNLQNRSFRH